jgi:hypothetical protein
MSVVMSVDGLNDLTLEQRAIIGNSKNLEMVINKVILPSARNSIGKPVAVNREIVRVFTLDGVKHQIRPIMKKRINEDEFVLTLNITRVSMRAVPEAYLTGDFTDLETLEAWLAEFLAAVKGETPENTSND